MSKKTLAKHGYRWIMVRGRRVKIKVTKEQAKRAKMTLGERKELLLKKLDKKVEKEFGFTNDIGEAGFMDRKGRLLDLSGKNQGGPGGYRARDHREINFVRDFKKESTQFGGRTRDMFRAMKQMGLIRLSDDSKNLMVDFVQAPNKKQASLLKILSRKRNIIADKTKLSGDVVDSGEFDNMTDLLRKFFGPKE